MADFFFGEKIMLLIILCDNLSHQKSINISYTNSSIPLVKPAARQIVSTRVRTQEAPSETEKQECSLCVCVCTPRDLEGHSRPGQAGFTCLTHCHRYPRCVRHSAHAHIYPDTDIQTHTPLYTHVYMNTIVVGSVSVSKNTLIRNTFWTLDSFCS